MRVKSCWFFCLAVLAVLTFQGNVAVAAEDVQILLTPELLTLTPGENAEVMIVVKNGSGTVLTRLQLSWLATPGIVVTCEQSSRASLPANSVWVQKASIRKNIDGPLAAKVNFQLQHAWQGKDDHLNVIFRALEIQHRSMETIDKIATIEIKTALTELQEHQQGLLYVIIKNITDIPIRIVQVSGNKPDFIDLQVQPADSLVTLSAQQAYAYVVVLSLRDAFQQGKHLLLLNAKLAWERNGQVFRGNLMSSHQLETGVIGESEILKLIGVPSFLLLPGFLMVMVFMAIWNRFQQPQITLTAATAKFWLIAITLSLLTAPLYPVITDIVGSPRNYLVGYGLFDVVLVWFGSIIAASYVCLLILGGITLYKYYQKIRKIPTPYDSPLEILEKLIHLKQNYPLNEATYKKNDKTEKCFVLLEAGDDVWLAPPIEIKFSEHATGDNRDRFNNEMPKIINWDELLNLLQQAQDEQTIEVAGWKDLPSLSIKKPEKKKREQVATIEKSVRWFIEF